MIFTVKKKRPIFSFSKKPQVSRPSEVIFGKRSNEKWERLIRKYGVPEYQSREGQPQINEYGRASFPDGTVFVVDAKTGDIKEFTERVRYIGVSKGLHFYIHEDNELLIGDRAVPSFPRT